MQYIDNAGKDNYWNTEWTNFALAGGSYPEDCGGLPPIPPVYCHLTMTGSTHTDVTVRGDADGTITIGTTGRTGSTSWYLNGVLKHQAAIDVYTFTGLTAGVYDVVVVDSANCTINGGRSIVVLDGEFRTGNFNVSYPSGLTAVENPIIVNVGTAVNSPNPLPCIFSIDVSGATIADNATITFNLSSPYAYSQTFYAKGYPNKPNYFLASQLKNQVGTPVGSNSLTEICTSLAAALQEDVLIPKIYYVNNSGTVVTLQAKENGVKFNLDNTNVIVSSGFGLTQMQAGVDYCDGQITDNYSISCEIMANTNITNQYPQTGEAQDFNRIAEMILPFQQSNSHLFDISSILKSQVSTPMPNTQMTGYTMLPSVMQPYYVKLSELYPLVPNTNTVKKRYKTEIPVNWTINSALDRFSKNTMEAYLGDDLSNVHGDFVVTSNNGAGTVVFSDYLISTGATGTTGVRMAIYNYDNSSIYKAWQTGNTFTGVASGNYWARLSGTSAEGYKVLYQKTFYTSNGGTGYDSRPVPHYKDNVKFLTNSPNPKQIQRASNEFLYFIVPKDYGKSLKVKSNLYFYDGTQVTGVTNFTIATGSTNAGGCLMMNLSYDKLGLQNYEVSGTTNRKIKRVELAVFQGDNLNGDFQYTEVKEYKFEIDEMPRKAGILFQNSLGMYDSFDFIGIVEETVKRETDNYTVPLNYNLDGSMPIGTKNVATYNTKVTKKVVVNTGWIDETHFDWLMELLKSNNIYSTSTTNQNYLNMSEYTYKKSSLDDLFDIEVTFDWTIYENNITV